MGLEQDRAVAGRRRALLIGVRETPYLARIPELHAEFPPLDFVERDVSLVSAALEQSDYEVFDKCDDTASGPVIAAVTEFLAECAPGDTAFLYFSCHGATVDGRDHLVLSDSQPGAPLADGSRHLLPRTLLRADPTELLASLPEGVTAVVCLDVCRAQAPRAVSGATDPGWSGGQRSYWLYSCGPGQRAFADPTTGSWFAQSLAAALSRVNPPTTFHAVKEFTQQELIRHADRHPRVPPPVVGMRCPEPAQGAEFDDPAVCEGTEQTLDWTRVIRESGLWRHTAGRPEVHARVKERLAELVRYVVGSGAQTRAYRDDPWADPLYPERLDARLTDLVARAAPEREDELLSAAETACLLSAAVVQEGIVAVTLAQLDALLPGPFDPGPRGREEEGGGDRLPRLMRDAARDVCRAHSLVVRTTETLRSRHLEPAVTAADHWLRHRFIADWDGLWERGGHAAVDELVTKVVEAIEAAADAPAPVRRSAEERLEIDSQVRQVLGHLTVKPGPGPRFGDSRHGDQWITAKPVRGNHWRGDQLARLLWTAGLLAADPRRLSSVLVDHLGAHEPLLPSAVVTALAGLDYDDTDGRTADSRAITVRLRCPHPALHAAVEELALAADHTVRAFGGPDTAAQPLLRGLPDRVTTEELRALPGRYKEPLERFRLAEDEIRPLLMGTQLYGDRMLAVRELYQNALDACRYREMRRTYGKVRAGWDGVIVFTQGWDGDRPYIECLDNGSGMSRARLTSMFARAGKRYEQDPEFVQERRNWRRAGIVDKSFTSRFGIGVFSYFMLADEVVVWTHAVDPTGRAGTEAPLRVDIRSGSGLLQINTSGDPEVPEEGGTRVRLYLAEPQEGEQVPSLVETLRTHLWVTEHEVTAQELTKDGETFRKLSWDPGQLAERDDWPVPPVPLCDGRGEGAGETWLVQGKGQLLLDGVLVENAPQVYGYVANLRERHAPVPSVDRNQLLSHDDELVTRELLERVPATAAQLAEVSLPWLWELAQKTPRLAVALLESLPEGTTATLGVMEGRRLPGGKVPLAVPGCLPTDRSLINKNYYSALGALAGGAHENTLFSRWRTSLIRTGQGEEPFSPEGYPDPEGLDALLFQVATSRGWQIVLHTAAQARCSPREALRMLRRYCVTGVEVPEAEDVRALDGLTVAQPAADLYFAYASLRRRLSARDDYDGYPLYHSSAIAGLRGDTPARHAPLLVLSAVHGVTLGEATDMLRTLRVLDPTLPEPPDLPPDLAKQRLTTDEVRRLAVTNPSLAPSPLQSNYDWLSGTVGPVDLFSRSSPPFTLADLIQRVEQFACLGYALDPRPTPEALESRTLPPDQQLLLSENLERKRPWIEGAVPFHHLLKIAHNTEARLGDVADRINAATAVTGAYAPEVPQEARDLIPESWLYRIFGERPIRDADDLVTPWELVGAFTNQDSSRIDQFRDAVRALDACGMLDWRGADMAALETQVNAAPHRFLAPHPAMSPYGSCKFDERGADMGYLMSVAAHFDLELGAVADELRRLDTSLELRVPDIPEDARDLKLNERDLHAVLRDGGYGLFNKSPRLKDRVSVLDVLRFTRQRGRDGLGTLGKAFRRLARLASVAGVALPGPPEEFDSARLEDFRPDDFDLAAFDEGLLGPGALGPLDLVRVAGRFGRTLGETYDRYAPFACLGLDVTVDAPEGDERDLRPGWQDLVVLTARLTGRAPALSDAVSDDHIALCAEETDLDEAGVHDLLSRYARLFRLTLPERKALAP